MSAPSTKIFFSSRWFKKSNLISSLIPTLIIFVIIRGGLVIARVPSYTKYQKWAFWIIPFGCHLGAFWIFLYGILQRPFDPSTSMVIMNANFKLIWLTKYCSKIYWINNKKKKKIEFLAHCLSCQRLVVSIVIKLK
jgi:hypothetical protein